MNPFKLGDKVRALCRVTDTGKPDDPWVHAEEGDEGEVVHLPEPSGTVVTVRFQGGTTTDATTPAYPNGTPEVSFPIPSADI